MDRFGSFSVKKDSLVLVCGGGEEDGALWFLNKLLLFGIDVRGSNDRQKHAL